MPSVLVTACCAPITSLFSRDINAPVWVRVKNAIGIRCTWSKSFDPHVVDETLADARGVPALHEREESGRDGKPDGAQREERHQRLVLVGDRRADQRPEQQRGDDGDARREDDDDQEADQVSSVGAGEAEHAPQQVSLEVLTLNEVRVTPEAHHRLMHHHFVVQPTGAGVDSRPGRERIL